MIPYACSRRVRPFRAAVLRTPVLETTRMPVPPPLNLTCCAPTAWSPKERLCSPSRWIMSSWSWSGLRTASREPRVSLSKTPAGAAGSSELKSCCLVRSNGTPAVRPGILDTLKILEGSRRPSGTCRNHQESAVVWAGSARDLKWRSVIRCWSPSALCPSPSGLLFMRLKQFRSGWFDLTRLSTVRSAFKSRKKSAPHRL